MMTRATTRVTTRATMRATMGPVRQVQDVPLPSKENGMLLHGSFLLSPWVATPRGKRDGGRGGRARLLLAQALSSSFNVSTSL
jgi:hypothetical protein